jgi:hypothetical protein
MAIEAAAADCKRALAMNKEYVDLFLKK